MATRDGTDMDAMALVKCFGNLGFEVVVKNNYSCEKMVDLLRKGTFLPNSSN